MIFSNQTKWSKGIYLFLLCLALLLSLPASHELFIATGKRWLHVAALSFALSYCLTPPIRWLATRWGIVDCPGGRKQHKAPTPLLGGAAIFFAYLVAIMANGIYSKGLLAILIGSAIMFAIGVMDDFREVPASIKLAGQIITAGLVMAFGIILRVCPAGWGTMGAALNLILTFLWIVGITNAMNFFDGMDGLASGLGAILAFFLGIVAFQTGQTFLGWISVAMVGSCLGFLPHNFRPKQSASIFLGDGGSTFIGYVLACLAIYGDWSLTRPIIAFTTPILIFWILIFDMAHITIDRIITGKVLTFKDWLEYVGRDHLHHRICAIVGGPKRSVLFLYLLAITLGTGAVVLRNARTVDAVLLLLQASMIVALLTILERRGRKLSGPKGQ